MNRSSPARKRYTKEHADGRRDIDRRNTSSSNITRISARVTFCFHFMYIFSVQRGWVSDLHDLHDPDHGFRARFSEVAFFLFLTVIPGVYLSFSCSAVLFMVVFN